MCQSDCVQIFILKGSYGEDMKLRPGVKGCAMLELKHKTAGNVSQKRVRGDLFIWMSYPASFAVLNETVYKAE